MKSILSKIHFQNEITIAGKMFLAFLLIYYTRISHHYFFIGIAFITFYGLVSKDFLSKFSFWFLICLAILPGLWSKFYFAGNHVFLLLYIAILFAIISFFKKFQRDISIVNARVLLGIVMFFAVLQKLLSGTFMSGSSLAFINSTGGFFTHFQRFFPENKLLIQQNLSRLNNQTTSVDNLISTSDLSSVHWIIDLEPNFVVYIILATEIIFLIALLIRNQFLRNGFFTLFIITLIFIRIETGFASLLCILLFLQALKDHLIFKLLYLGIFCVYISLILTRLGAF